MILPGAPYEYNFEIETILEQFIALIDGAVTRRYNKNQATGERIFKEVVSPMYTVGTKQRVLYFLNNKAKNHVFPVVCVSLLGLSANKDKFAAKYNKIQYTENESLNEMFRPLPIIINVKVSIIAKLITDIYQIYGNLASKFSRSHNFISWYVTSSLNDSYSTRELRNKVEWNMNANLTQRDKITETDEDKFVAEMEFTIEGWLFPEKLHENKTIIKDIGSNVIVNDALLNRIINLGNVNAENDAFVPLMRDFLNKDALKAQVEKLTLDDKSKEFLLLKIDELEYKNPREYATNRPQIVNIFLQEPENNSSLLIDKDRLQYITKSKDGKIIFDGYNFENCKALLTTDSGGGDIELNFNIDLNPPNIEGNNIDYSKYKTNKIKGYELNSHVINKNMLSIDISDISSKYNGNKLDIVIYNNDDYALLGAKLDSLYPISF